MIPMLEFYKERWQVDSDRSIKPGLEAIQAALQQLGHPEQQLAVVHFAGTNGKGSTLTFVEQIAREHGLSVGKFMSPCILDVHDQIQLNGEPISSAQMDALFKQMYEAGLSGKLTDFELLTCAALLYFKQQAVDLVLLEVGMGGREDSTNVVMPIVSVIPSIALEHTNFLGTTIESIAAHKAGIIKEGKPVVIGRLPEVALAVVGQQAKLKNAPLYTLGEQFNVNETEQGERYTYLERSIELTNLHRQLLGSHQAHNMALAITAFFEVATALQIPFNSEAIQAGVAQAKVPGRFEEVLPNVYFDGAHNPASAHMLATTVAQYFPHKKIEFVIGMLADKDVETVLRKLERVSDTFYFVDFTNVRAMQANKIMELSKAQEKSIVQNVGALLQQELSKNTIRVVAGSLYLLSEIRKIMIHSKQ